MYWFLVFYNFFIIICFINLLRLVVFRLNVIYVILFWGDFGMGLKYFFDIGLGICLMLIFFLCLMFR